MHTCQMNILVAASKSSSGQCLRGMANGTFNHTSAKASTGSPSHIDRVLNSNGGMPVTPNFITGQFKPHTIVRIIKSQSCFAESFCIE